MASKEWMLSYVHALANAGMLVAVNLIESNLDPFVVRNLVGLTSLIMDTLCFSSILC